MTKPDKLGSKILRKQAKAMKIASREYELKEVAASRHLLICNAGLVTGASREDLLPLFSQYGPVQCLLLIPHKSFSFVSYRTAAAAETAFTAINGQVDTSSHVNGPLYLAYVDRIPEMSDQSKASPPNGLHLLRDFISCEEEKILADLLNASFQVELECSDLKNRRVKHFGFEFDYSVNDIDADKPIDEGIPVECAGVLQRLLETGFIPELPDQLTVNLYQPGHGIPPHTDSHCCCTDWLVSLSLVSGVIMEFRNREGCTVPVWLPPRSLLILKDEARYAWRHGITPRHSDIVDKQMLDGELDDAVQEGTGLAEEETGLTLVPRGTRISLTFRKTTNKPCSCDFPADCESRRGGGLFSSDAVAATIENQMVHQVYEEIAGHFSETRHKPWPRVLQFLESLPAGSVLVDLGCGNGKYLGAREGLFEIGSDFSQNLLQIVTERGHQGVRADMLYSGFRDGIAGGLLCIAALHHLYTPTRRYKAVEEMCRILGPGGQMLIYVWAKDQRKDDLSSYLKQNKKNLRPVEEGAPDAELGEFGLPVHENRTNFVHQDVLVPWKLKGSGSSQQAKTFKRFYHVFEEGELEELVTSVPGMSVVSSYYDQGNWCLIAQKCT